MPKQAIADVRALPENQRFIIKVTRESGAIEELGFRKPKRMEVQATTTQKDTYAASYILMRACCLTHDQAEVDAISDEFEIVDEVVPALLAMRKVGVEAEKKA